MKFTLKRRIIASTVLPMILVMLIYSYVSISAIISMGKERVDAFRTTLIDQKKKELVNYVNIAIKGAIEGRPLEDAKQAVRRLTFGEGGYVWVNDFDHVILAHPDSRLDQTDQTEMKDPNGVYIMKEFVNVCKKSGEGFVSYSFRKLGEDKLSPKLSYVKSLGKNGWIVGSGIYIDDVDAVVAAEEARVQKVISALIVKNLLLMLVVVAGISLFMTYLMNRYVNRPMKGIVTTLQEFDNDLTVRIEGDFKHEFADLASQFNDLIDKLHHIISRLTGATMEVASSVTEISSAIEEQAAISTEQSASVSEITSTMEEFSASSKQIAEHSESVADLATRSLDNTRRGADAVGTIMAKMNEINDDNEVKIVEIVELGKKSREITKVMELINHIADQTKLIAFNAAIEASSAGEAGKRFGVVAAEIRRLADSVMESTEEIDGKIHEIQEAVNRLVIVSEKGSKRIQEGLAYSNETAGLLNGIVDAAKSTAGAAKQISLSTHQQETASEQVVLALHEMDEGARQTSLSITQIGSTIAGLKRLAETLTEIVEKFKLGSDSADD